MAEATMKEALAGIPACANAPWITHCGDDPTSWNLHRDDEEEDGEGSGLPGTAVLSEVLALFSDCWAGFDAPTAARVFNLPVELVEILDIRPSIMPHRRLLEEYELGNLIATLIACRSEEISIGFVAEVTNQSPNEVIRAIGHSRWLYVTADRDALDRILINVDGE